MGATATQLAETKPLNRWHDGECPEATLAGGRLSWMATLPKQGGPSYAELDEDSMDLHDGSRGFPGWLGLGAFGQADRQPAPDLSALKRNSSRSGGPNELPSPNGIGSKANS